MTFVPYDKTKEIAGCRSLTKDERVGLCKELGIDWTPPDDFGEPGWFERAGERAKRNKGIMGWIRRKMGWL